MDQERTYSTKEAAEILKTADRTVRRYLNSYYRSEGNGFQISEKMMELLKKEIWGQGADKVRTDSGQSADSVSADSDIKDIEVEYDVVEGFSTEEYQEFQKRLIEYPMLIKDLEYHRESAKSHQRQMEIILRNLEQRNYIEAKDKRLDDDDFVKP